MAYSIAQYSTLSTTREIRLLYLLPGDKLDGIKCKLEHAQLDKNLKYEALSYMWGPPYPTHTIEIDGRVWDIRENLWQALRHLRLREEERILWVDALCINQIDNVERSHQVAQMGRVYGLATKVCLWLGTENESSHQAFKVVKDWGLSQAIDFRKRNNRVAVEELLARPYWKRLWIIQEVVLASNIDIFCGESVMAWDLLDHALRIYAMSRTAEYVDKVAGSINAADLMNATHSITRAYQLCRQRQTRLQFRNLGKDPHTAFPLLSLFLMYRESGCTEVQDKIFGLHGLAAECCRAAIPVDYTCSGYDLCGMLLEHSLDFGHLNHSDKIEVVVETLRALYEHLVTASMHPGIPKLVNLDQTKSSLVRSGVPDTKKKYELSFCVRSCIHFVAPSVTSLKSERGSFWVPGNLLAQFEHTAKILSRLRTKKERDLNETVYNVRDIDIDGSSQWLETRSMSNTEIPYQTTSVAVKSDHPFIQLLNAISEEVAYVSARTPEVIPMTSNSFVAFFDLDGELGIAPESARAGDILCFITHPGSYLDNLINKTVLVVRNVEGKAVAVGQAAYLEYKFAEQGDERISVELDIATLQYLSAKRTQS